eukprot:1107409-Pleurochrysis_carterae.AAC.2
MPLARPPRLRRPQQSQCQLQRQLLTPLPLVPPPPHTSPTPMRPAETSILPTRCCPPKRSRSRR